MTRPKPGPLSHLAFPVALLGGLLAVAGCGSGKAPVFPQEQEGAPAACRAQGDNRKWSAFVDIYSKDASGCVARDMELDSQWNQVQSAVTAFDGCVDCTRPRAARATSCQRVSELLDAADKATP